MSATDTADVRKKIKALSAGADDQSVTDALNALRATPQVDSNISAALKALTGTVTADSRKELAKAVACDLDDKEGRPPILIFRPFQTWTVSCRNLFAFVADAHALTLPILSCATLHRWHRAFCSRQAVNSATRSVSYKSLLLRQCDSVCKHADLMITFPSTRADGHHDMQLQVSCDCSFTRAR